jgi:hypothetical protein
LTNHLTNGKVRVRVWHRTDGDAFIRGWDYEPTNPALELAYVYEVDLNKLQEDAPHVDCFRVNNRVTGAEWELPTKHNTRSLSVGDVVEVGSPNQTIFWGVNAFGWQTIPQQTVFDAQRRGSTEHLPV